MKNISKILCIVDPTAEEQHAIERAAWIAGCTDAELELHINYYNEYLSGDRFFDSRSLRKARKEVMASHLKQLEEIAAPLREKGLTVTTSAVWDHPLHDGIVRQATTSKADLVVKDTHYHSAAARVLLSNTDWQLIRNCGALLWLVKPRDIPARPVFIASIDPMNEHDKPAALDDEILVTSKLLADSCDGEVRAFHAYDPRMAIATAASNAYLPVSLPLDEFDKQMKDQHGKRMQEVTSYHGLRDDHVDLVAGRAHEELPALAVQLDAAVVVMGAVARNRLQRLFIGATAERTLDHLPCDMLIVKPDWFEVPEDILNTKLQAA